MKALVNRSSVCPSHREHERGSALILAMFVSVVAVGITVSGTFMMKAQRTRTEATFVMSGQASQFASSGITEALNWLRLQPSQPVQVFDPVLDDMADPAILETDEPEIGLVRSFQINGIFWGRYEIWKQWDADPDPERLAWRQRMQMEDVSRLRGDPQPGSVWRIKCAGYVYRNVDPNKAFDEYPNQVLGSEILETEVRRLNLSPPTAAAVSMNDGAKLNISGEGFVEGGTKGAGVGYAKGKTTPNNGLAKGKNQISGSPATTPSPDYDDSVQSVFGVDEQELRAMADMAVTNEAEFPSPIPMNSIIYSDVASMTLDAGNPLSGFGVVYHTGNLSLEPGNSSNFSGLLYVNGDLVVTSPADLKGTVIVTGNVAISGTGDFSTLSYDPAALAALQEKFGQYRFSTPVRRLNR